MPHTTLSLADVTLANLPDSALVPARLPHLVELARLLQQAGVAVLNAGVVNGPNRFTVVHELGSSVQEMTLMVESGLDRRHITFAAEALKRARRQRLGLLVPTTPDAVCGQRWSTYTDLLASLEDCVQYACRIGLAVDLVIEGASRTEPFFLGRVARQAIAAGATGLTLVESGELSVEAFANEVQRIARAVGHSRIGVRCHSRHGLGVSLSLIGLENGACEAGCVASQWQGEGPCPALEQFADLGLLDLSPGTAAQIGALVHSLAGAAPLAQGQAAPGTFGTARND